MKFNFVTAKQFKDLATDSKTNIKQYGIFKQFAAEEIKETSDGVLQFTISTESVDREYDTIKASGWDFKAYRKNPVVLWGHDYRLPPIATSSKEWVEGDKVKSEMSFISDQLPAESRDYDHVKFSAMVHQLYLHRIMRAVSVGFRPTKFEFSEEDGRMERMGMDFIKQELMEYSCVPVPANPEALLESRSKGIDISPMARWAEERLDKDETSGLYIPKEDLEKIARMKPAGKGTAVDVTTKNGDLDEDKEPEVESKGDGGLDQDEMVVKAGRTLSKANEARLRKASDLLKEVLDQLGSEEGDEKDLPPIEEKTHDPESSGKEPETEEEDDTVIEIVDDEPEKSGSRGMTKEEIDQIIRNTMNEFLMQITGKVA